MKFRDLIKLVQADGWQLHHQTGSHRQFRHPIKRVQSRLPGNLARTCRQGPSSTFFAKLA
jgi:predicted RNA binding protein YcfA (HicA-like mRNA interferase family)